MKRGWPPASKGLLHPAGGRRLGRAVSRGGCTRPCLVEHSPDRPLWLRCLGDMAKPKTRRAARCSLAGRRACRRRARLGHAHERRGLQGCGTSRSRGGAGALRGRAWAHIQGKSRGHCQRPPCELQASDVLPSVPSCAERRRPSSCAH